MIKNNLVKSIEISFFLLCFFAENSFAQLASSAWPIRGQNPQHTGRSTSVFSTSNTVSWKYQTDDNVTSSSAIGIDGTIYFGSYDTNIYAINSDGTLKWKYKTGKYIVSSPVIGVDGTVYIGSGDKYLYAIKSDGTLKWKYETGDAVFTPSIGTDGVVYAGSGNYLYAINFNGTLRWKYETGGIVSSAPAIGTDGAIYAGSLDNYLYTIKYDGTLKWKYKAGDMVDSSPSIGTDGTVYFGSADTYIYALNSDGTLKWRYQTGNNIRYSSPAIGAEGTVFVGSYDNYLYAINPDGTLKWKFLTGNVIWSSPAIGLNGTVYFGSADKNIYAINPDGTLRWKYITDYVIESSPAIGANGALYIGSNDNCLYAFAPENNSLLLTSPKGGEIFTAGSVKSITWTSSGVAKTKIEYSTDGGISWTTIAQTQQYGSFDWSVADTLSTNCLIKISDASNSSFYDINPKAFSIIKPSLTLTYPNGGERFATFRPVTVKWTSTSNNKVKLEYSTDSKLTWTTIIQSMQSAGSYNWTVPGITSQKCFVRITDSDFQDVSDTSDSVFTISQPSITLTYPNGGERIAAGRNSAITWISTFDGTVKIEYSANSGSSWTTIADSTLSNGSYTWTVPNTISSKYLIKITDTVSSIVTDISNATFSVAQPSITVTFPNGGEILGAGKSAIIKWTYATDNNVKIEYSSDGAVSWTTISASALSTGLYNWTVPDIKSEKCYVRISDVLIPDVFDVSNAAFEITKISPPSAFTASDVPNDNGHQIQLSWTLSPDDGNIDGYRIYRSRKPVFNEPAIDIKTITSIEELVEKEQVSAILIAEIAHGETNYIDSFMPLNDVEYYYWIESFMGVSSSAKIQSGKITPVEKEILSSYKVNEPYPNPFNPSTTISYYVPVSGQVFLSVYNLSGQKVAALVESFIEAGRHEAIFDGSGLASGVYLYRFEAGGFSKTGKMLLIK